MFGSYSQPNPQSRFQTPKSIHSQINGTNLNSNFAFLKHQMQEIKDADLKLQEGIEETRQKLVRSFNFQTNQSSSARVSPKHSVLHNSVLGTNNNTYSNIGSKIVINPLYTPTNQQQQSMGGTINIIRNSANSVSSSKVPHSQPVSPSSQTHIRDNSIKVFGSEKQLLGQIQQKNKRIKQLEFQLQELNIKFSTLRKGECSECKKYKEIIAKLEQKISILNHNFQRDSNQYMFEIKMICSEKDSYKLKLAQFDKDKAEQISHLQAIIDDLKRKQSFSSPIYNEKWRQSNQTTKTQNTLSLKSEIETLKSKNTYLAEKLKDKIERLSELQLRLSEARQLQESQFVQRYSLLERSTQIEPMMKRFQALNAKLQEIETQNHGYTDQISQLLKQIEQYKDQNLKLKLVNEKYQADLQDKKEQIADFHIFISELKQKNVQTVSQYNELVQKYEKLEERTRRYSGFGQTEVSSQLSVHDKKEKELVSKLEQLTHQFEFVKKEKQAQVGERKVYQIKCKELNEKVKELSEENYKLKCMLRDEDSQQSQVVYFNKDKIQTLLGHSRQRQGFSDERKKAKSVISQSPNAFTRRTNEIDKVKEEGGSRQRQNLQLEALRLKRQALVKKIQILSTPARDEEDHELHRQESQKKLITINSKFKLSQIEIGNGEGPVMPSSPKSKPKLHRNSESNAQIQIPDFPQQIRYPQSSISKENQKKLWQEWKQWSKQMDGTSQKLQKLIAELLKQKQILAQRSNEISMQRNQLYTNLCDAQAYIQKLGQENTQLNKNLHQNENILKEMKNSLHLKEEQFGELKEIYQKQKQNIENIWKKEIELLNKNVNEANNMIKQLERDKQREKRISQSIKIQSEQIKEQLGKKNEQIASLNQEISLKILENTKLNLVISQNRTQMQKIKQEFYNKQKVYTTNMEEIQSKLKTIETKLAYNDQNNHKISHQKSRQIQAIKTQIKLKDQIIDKLSQQINTLIKEKSQMEGNLINAQNYIQAQSIERQKDREAISEELKQYYKRYYAFEVMIKVEKQLQKYQRWQIENRQFKIKDQEQIQRKTEEKQQNYEKIIAKLNQDLKSNKQSYENRIKSIQVQSKRVRQQKQKLYNDLERAQQHIAKIQVQLRQENVIKQDLKKQIQDIRAIDLKNEENTKANILLQQEINRIKQQLTKQRTKTTSAKAQSQLLSNQNTILKEKYHKIQNQFNNLKRLNIDQTNLKQTLQKQKEISKKLSQELEQRNKQVLHYKSEYERVYENLANAETYIQAIIQKSNQKMMENQKLKVETRVNMKHIEELKTQVQHLKGNVEELEQVAQTLKKKISSDQQDNQKKQQIKKEKENQQEMNMRRLKAKLDERQQAIKKKNEEKYREFESRIRKLEEEKKYFETNLINAENYIEKILIEKNQLEQHITSTLNKQYEQKCSLLQNQLQLKQSQITNLQSSKQQTIRFIQQNQTKFYKEIENLHQQKNTQISKLKQQLVSLSQQNKKLAQKSLLATEQLNEAQKQKQNLNHRSLQLERNIQNIQNKYSAQIQHLTIEISTLHKQKSKLFQQKLKQSNNFATTSLHVQQLELNIEILKQQLEKQRRINVQMQEIIKDNSLQREKYLDQNQQLIEKSLLLQNRGRQLTQEIAYLSQQNSKAIQLKHNILVENQRLVQQIAQLHKTISIISQQKQQVQNRLRNAQNHIQTNQSKIKEIFTNQLVSLENKIQGLIQINNEIDQRNKRLQDELTRKQSQFSQQLHQLRHRLTISQQIHQQSSINLINYRNQQTRIQQLSFELNQKYNKLQQQEHKLLQQITNLTNIQHILSNQVNSSEQIATLEKQVLELRIQNKQLRNHQLSQQQKIQQNERMISNVFVLEKENRELKELLEKSAHDYRWIEEQLLKLNERNQELIKQSSQKSQQITLLQQKLQIKENQAQANSQKAITQTKNQYEQVLAHLIKAQSHIQFIQSQLNIQKKANALLTQQYQQTDTKCLELETQLTNKNLSQEVLKLQHKKQLEILNDQLLSLQQQLQFFKQGEINKDQIITQLETKLESITNKYEALRKVYDEDQQELIKQKLQIENLKSKNKKLQKLEEQENEQYAQEIKYLQEKVRLAEQYIRAARQNSKDQAAREQEMIKNIKLKDEKIARMSVELDQANKQLQSTKGNLESTHKEIQSIMEVLTGLQQQFKILSQHSLNQQLELRRYHSQNVELTSQLEQSYKQKQDWRNKLVHAQKHIKYQEEYIDQTQQKNMPSLDQDYINLLQRLDNIILLQKKKVYEAFINEHPEQRQVVILSQDGQLIIQANDEKGIQIDLINQLNNQLEQVEQHRRNAYGRLQGVKLINDKETKLKEAQRIINEIEHIINKTQPQPPKPTEKEISLSQQIEALHGRVQEQEQKIAYLQQQLKNKNTQLELSYKQNERLNNETRNKAEEKNKLLIKQDLLQSNFLEEKKKCQEEYKNIIIGLHHDIRSLNEQLVNKQKQDVLNRKKLQSQIQSLLQINQNQEKQFIQQRDELTEKHQKELHKIKQNLIIVQGIRQQLTEQAQLLSQQVKRYEQIITQLNSKQAQSLEIQIKNNSKSIEIQKLQAELAQLRGRYEILEEQKDVQVKELKSQINKLNIEKERNESILREQIQALTSNFEGQLYKESLQRQNTQLKYAAQMEEFNRVNKQLINLSEVSKKIQQGHANIMDELIRMQEGKKQLEDEYNRQIQSLRRRAEYLDQEKREAQVRISQIERQYKEVNQKYETLIRYLQEIVKLIPQNQAYLSPRQVQSQNKQMPIQQTVQKIKNTLNHYISSNVQLTNQAQHLHQENINLTHEIVTINDKLKQFTHMATELQKQLQDLYSRFQSKEVELGRVNAKKDEQNLERDRLMKANDELVQEIQRRQKEYRQNSAVFENKIRSLENSQINLVQQNKYFKRKLQEAERKIQQYRQEKELEAQIQKARMSAQNSEDSSQNKYYRKKPNKKKDITDEERIIMLERLVYQLEEQVKSFERSLETLTLQLQVYQAKELEWVEDQNKMSDAIDYARKITDTIQNSEGPIMQKVQQSSLPWLNSLKNAIQQKLQILHKEIQVRDEQIINLKQQIANYKNKCKQNQKSQLSPEEKEDLEERYEQLFTQLVELETANEKLQEEVDSLNQQLLEHMKKVEFQEYTPDKPVLQTPSSKQREQEGRPKKLRLQLEDLEVESRSPQSSQRKSSRVREGGNIALQQFLRSCLQSLQIIEQTVCNIENEAWENQQKLEKLINDIEQEQKQQYRKSMKSSTELVKEFKDLLHTSDLNEPKIQQEQGQIHYEEHIQNLTQPVQIKNIQQLKKEMRNLSQIVNLYHAESERKRVQFSRTIKKLQLEMAKLKQIYIQSVRESENMAEGSNADRIMAKIGEINEKLHEEYQQLLETGDLERIQEQEDPQQQSLQRTPKSSAVRRTPKSIGYSRNSDISQERPARISQQVQAFTQHNSIEILNMIERVSFERSQLLELKKKINKLKSRQDKQNLAYLKDNSVQIEEMIEKQIQKLPQEIANDRSKILQILADNLTLSQIQQLINSKNSQLIVKLVFEKIGISEQHQYYQPRFNYRLTRRALSDKINKIRQKYYEEQNTFSKEILDCLIGLYQTAYDVEQFLIITDKLFEVSSQMQKMYVQILQERGKTVGQHQNIMKKILQRSVGDSSEDASLNVSPKKQQILRQQRSQQQDQE